MNDNKGQTIFLSVIGIATLLVAIIGATFAYFTTTMSGEAATADLKTASVGTVKYEAEDISNTSMYPDWTSGDKTLNVNLSADSSVAYDYACYFEVVTNEPQKNGETVVAGREKLKDMFLKVTSTDAAADITATTNGAALSGTNGYQIPVDATKIQIAKGTLAANGATGHDKNFTYSLTFGNGNTDQNSQQGATFVGKVYCESQTDGEKTLYYNDANKAPNGTETQPGA